MSQAEQYKLEYISKIAKMAISQVENIINNMPNNSNDPMVNYVEDVYQYINDYLYKTLNLTTTTIIAGGAVTTYATEIVRLTHQEILNRMINHTYDLLAEYKHNLVYVPSNTVASPLCVKRQGKVYWTNIRNKDYPELEPEMFIYGGGLFILIANTT